MIRYDLKCANGHAFDSWFSSGADFDKLARANLLSCVVCGVSDIEKAIMAPRVSLGETRPVSVSETPAQTAVKDLREKIESTATDVGSSFATEARKMHDGDTPKRAIYGEAKPEDAKALIEDGVPILPLPWNSRKVN